HCLSHQIHNALSVVLVNLMFLYFLLCSLPADVSFYYSFFFFNDTPPTEIYTLSLHDALPISLYVVREPRAGPEARAFAQWAMNVARPRILSLRLPDGTPAFGSRPGDCTALGLP